jgi:exodeoxyribonuclease VII large subunit
MVRGQPALAPAEVASRQCHNAAAGRRVEQSKLDFEMQASTTTAGRRALSVSQLTELIRGALEPEFVDVWVEGEVSNLTIAASGHWYFSLKDEKASIRAVAWKSQARLIRFRPKDGMKVVARGSLRVYAPKGEYQISVELLEPLGKGSLQQAFEELKEKLDKEGLFAPERKRPLPMLPQRIGIVTSPTGAVIRDILRVLERRFANVEVLIYPARVQGAEAAGEIVAGLRALGDLGRLDVVIVARGGGSLEDLWPFNEEAVARALAACPVPTVSAVGHETDFTIADFVADVRAPTPSAAAEMVVQAKAALAARVEAAGHRLAATIELRLTRLRARVSAAAQHRVFAAERGRIMGQAQRVDELARRAETALTRRRERARDAWRRLGERLEAFRWDRQIVSGRERVGRSTDRLAAGVRALLDTRRGAFGRLAGKLDSLSPLAVLGRGYALVWSAERGQLVRDPAEVAVGERLRVRVSAGEFAAEVTSKEIAKESP